MKSLLALFASALLAAGATACGGGSAGSDGSAGSPSTASNPTSAPTTTSAPLAATTASSAGTKPARPAPTETDSSPSSSPAKRYPHGDNSIQTFGKAGGEADRQAIAKIVTRYYAAVAAGHGAEACGLLSSGLSKSIVQSFGRARALRDKGCAGILGLLFKPRSGRAAAALTSVEVTGVRLKGDHGFALLRSKEMPSGEITVNREAGAWKIGALIGSSLH